jgi:hypothetical protein
MMFINWMLIMVMANPMLFTIVSDEPRDSSGACCATNVENNGESAITTNPQKNRNVSNIHKDPCSRKNGESRQQSPESNNASVAILLAG